MRRRYLPRNAFFLVGGILALWACSLDGTITRFEGFALVLYYALYLYIIISRRADSISMSALPTRKSRLRRRELGRRKSSTCADPP